MSLRFFKTATIAPGSQFLGTELSAAPGKPTHALQVKEILLKMGTEAKTYFIEKVYAQGGGTVRSVLLTAVASVDSDVIINGADAPLLLPGEQIQVRTTGATSAMNLRVQYEDVDNSVTRSANDPITTR